MADPAVFVGTGITLTFGTTSFTCEILDVTPPGLSRESFQTSHQGTTGAHTYLPGKLYDPGEFGFRFNYDPTKSPPIGSAAEEVTLTYPDAQTEVVTAFMVGYTPEGAFEDVMVGSATLKISGAIDRNASS